MIDDEIERELLNNGAAIVGFTEIKENASRDIAGLTRAVSIGVDRKLNENTVSLLVMLHKKAARFLKSKGYRYLCIPPDSDRIKDKFIAKLYHVFDHKMAATSAGIGWVGKNGLLISPEYGPRLSLVTVLTNAPLSAGAPIEFSMCGGCSLCVDFCPSNAITGREWSRYEPYVELVNKDNCASHKKKSVKLKGKPNCGMCINICPYGRKNFKGAQVVQII